MNLLCNLLYNFSIIRTCHLVHYLDNVNFFKRHIRILVQYFFNEVQFQELYRGTRVACDLPRASSNFYVSSNVIYHAPVPIFMPLQTWFIVPLSISTYLFWLDSSRFPSRFDWLEPIVTTCLLHTKWPISQTREIIQNLIHRAGIFTRGKFEENRIDALSLSLSVDCFIMKS